MPSPQSSRRNLEIARVKRGGPTAQESLVLKHGVYTWYFTPEEERQPSSRRQLARALGCSRQYVDQVIKTLPLTAPYDIQQQVAEHPVTPADVQKARQARQQRLERIAQGPASLQMPAPVIEPMPLPSTAVEAPEERKNRGSQPLRRQLSPYTRPMTIREWQQAGYDFERGTMAKKRSSQRVVMSGIKPADFGR